MSQHFRFGPGFAGRPLAGNPGMMAGAAEDAENAGTRKHKAEGMGGLDQGKEAMEPAQKKRAALGTLTNVENRRFGQVPVKPDANMISKETKATAQTVNKENEEVAYGYYQSRKPSVGPLVVNQPIHANMQRSGVLAEQLEVQNMDADCSEDSPELLSYDEDLSEDDVVEGEELVVDDPVAEVDAAFELRQDRLVTLAEYRREIYEYLRGAELRYRAKPGYMRKQPDVTSAMRRIMVDWMVEVGEEYKLGRETLFLAVNYVDRFLSSMSVLRGKLQLVGTAAMFIAAKYEEIYPPEVKEFAYITDDTYTLQQIIRMEYLMLRALSFDVAAPTTNCFCERYLKESGADEKTRALSMYLIELTLLDDSYLHYLPSVTAASAICLANCTLGEEPWCESLRETSTYELADFDSCLRELHQTYYTVAAQEQQAIRTKYTHASLFHVSKLQPPSFLPV